MARKTKTRKRHKKGGAAYQGNNSSSNTPAAAPTGEEKTNQDRYGPSDSAAGPVRHIVEFSQGKYFNKNVEDGQILPESQQPCLICHNTEGPLRNKGAYQLNVRIRKCSNCKSLFHRRCLARYFSVRACDGLESNCPVCKKIWPSEEDVIFLLEEEQSRMDRETQQSQPIEQQFQNIEIPVTRTRSLAGRFCEFTRRRLEDLRRNEFFGPRRNNSIVPMGGEGKRKTRKRKNKRKRTRKVKRRRKRKRNKSKKVLRK